MTDERGQTTIIFFIIAALVVSLFLFKGDSFTSTTTTNAQNPYCRPESITSTSPEINTFSYTGRGIPTTTKKYFKLIKSEVPMVQRDNWLNKHFTPSPDTSIITRGNNSYRIYFPTEATSETFSPPDGSRLEFDQYGIIFLFKVDQLGTPIQITLTNDTTSENFYIVDAYQEVLDSDHLIPKQPLPASVLNCQDGTDRVYTLPQTITYNQSARTDDHKQLQLDSFQITNNTQYSFHAWFTPECKPAIYLYPKVQENISVKVNPSGFLTYTNPTYPQNGWYVNALPNGNLQVDGRHYSYLYYESKIFDSAINIPQKGYVVSFNKIHSLYNSLLPKLGLNNNESIDYINYWEKYLPYAPFYFISILPEEDIKKIEPIEVNPKPNTTIRIRLYYQPLNQFTKVDEPTIITPERSGYTLVEWGGLVKTDKSHPFTCSQ